ncbi:hypothetical protein ACFSQ7_47470 [Paenibacillus rhizoplanae]
MQREALRREATLRLKEAARLLPQAASTQELGTGLLDMIMGMPFFPSSVLVFFEEQPGGYPLRQGVEGGGDYALCPGPPVPVLLAGLSLFCDHQRGGGGAGFCSNVR